MSEEKSTGFSRLIDAVATWLERVFPSVLATATLIYSWMLSKLRAEEKAHDKTKLEKELVQNELDVERDFSGKSNDDIIRRASRRGRSKSDH